MSTAKIKILETCGNTEFVYRKDTSVTAPIARAIDLVKAGHAEPEDEAAFNKAKDAYEKELKAAEAKKAKEGKEAAETVA